MEKFQQHVRKVFSACQQAVNNQLSARPGESAVGFSQNGQAPAEAANTSPSRIPSAQSRPATAPQVRAVRSLADQQQVNLAELLCSFGVAEPGQLSIRDASLVIDELNANTKTAHPRQTD